MDTTTEETRRIEQSGPPRRQIVHVYALGFWLLSVGAFWQALRGLASLSFQDERSSHILLIPLITAGLLVLHHDRIFRSVHYSSTIGVPLILFAAILWYSLRAPLSRLNQTDYLSSVAALIVLVWIAGFILFYGIAAFEEGLFPLLFLVLMIPVPVSLGNYTVSLLQRGSAEMCDLLFRLVGVPILRSGFRFSLPGVDIEVAEQCSGIHSALALLIAGLLLQHFLLPGMWKKVVFMACVFPIAIFKNAVRIVTIAWLGIHVNPEFFHGQLHRQGGLPFAVLAVAVLGLLLWVLRKMPGRGNDT